MEKKSRKKIILWIILSIVLFFGLWAVLYIHYSTPTRLAMEYIYNHTQPDGRFIYKTNPDSDVKYDKSEYNEVRHAGVLYSMYLAEIIRKDRLLKKQRIMASQYFVDNYVRKIANDMFVVINHSNWASLGGAGLGLVALSNLYPDGYVKIDVLRGLGKFIVYLQNPDGSFNHEYDTSTGKFMAYKSDYYPGEAALGLLYLYEVDKNKLWVDSARKALLYLAKKSSESKEEPYFDHWMLIATKKLFETPDNGLTDKEKKILRKTARDLSSYITGRQILYPDDPFVGSFLLTKSLNSVSTITEGLSAAYYIIEDKPAKIRISKAIKLSSKYLDKHQIKEGKLVGGIPAKPDWYRSANKNDGEIRIDNVQHALSAWLTSKNIK